MGIFSISSASMHLGVHRISLFFTDSREPPDRTMPEACFSKQLIADGPLIFCYSVAAAPRRIERDDSTIQARQATSTPLLGDSLKPTPSHRSYSPASHSVGTSYSSGLENSEMPFATESRRRRPYL